MKKSPYIRKGLEQAGFRGGWLAPEEDASELPQANPNAAAARALGMAESRAAAAEAQEKEAQPSNNRAQPPPQ